MFRRLPMVRPVADLFRLRAGVSAAITSTPGRAADPLPSSYAVELPAGAIWPRELVWATPAMLYLPIVAIFGDLGSMARFKRFGSLGDGRIASLFSISTERCNCIWHDRS